MMSKTDAVLDIIATWNLTGSGAIVDLFLLDNI